MYAISNLDSFIELIISLPVILIYGLLYYVDILILHFKVDFFDVKITINEVFTC